MITDYWLTTAIVIRIVMLTHVFRTAMVTGYWHTSAIVVFMCSTVFRAAMVTGCQITICRIRAGTGMLTMSFAVGF